MYDAVVPPGCPPGATFEVKYREGGGSDEEEAGGMEQAKEDEGSASALVRRDGVTRRDKRAKSGNMRRTRRRAMHGTAPDGGGRSDRDVEGVQSGESEDDGFNDLRMILSSEDEGN